MFKYFTLMQKLFILHYFSDDYSLKINHKNFIGNINKVLPNYPGDNSNNKIEIDKETLYTLLTLVSIVDFDKYSLENIDSSISKNISVFWELDSLFQEIRDNHFIDVDKTKTQSFNILIAEFILITIFHGIFEIPKIFYREEENRIFFNWDVYIRNKYYHIHVDILFLLYFSSEYAIFYVPM